MAQVSSTTGNDGVPTRTSNEQEAVERACNEVFSGWLQFDGQLERDSVYLQRSAHATYLLSGLGELSSAYTSLDASRPWLCYWVLHSLELLGSPYSVADPVGAAAADFLARCQDEAGGGFCGGPWPGQIAHLAPTYAAINALATIGGERALSVVRRGPLSSFLHRMKRPHGGFTMHEDGECDVRGAYTAMAVASLCNLLTPQLVEKTAEWIASCQTYEGGIGATPGEEAHGGYTFCGLAALALLGKVHLLRLPQLTHWLVSRQMGMHGGFQGRTNKTVDGCYSFWQGGAFPLLQAYLGERGLLGPSETLFSSTALLDYSYICSQCPNGGLRDKPGRGRDFYHTCYSISGISVAAHQPQQADHDVPEHWLSSIGMTNPIYNIAAGKAEAALAYFEQLPAVPPPEPL